MKISNIIITATLLTVFSAFGQNKTEGVIHYEMKMNIHAGLSKEQLAYKTMIPEFIQYNIDIHFKNEFCRVKKQEAIVEQGGNKISINTQSFGGSDMLCDNKQNVYYSFIRSGKQTYYTENKYAISDIENGKISKKILGYNCFKSLQKDDKGEMMELWITQDLNTSANPVEPHTKKGVVLEINSEKVNWKATKIELKPQDQKLFVIPSGAKKITEEQAEDLTQEAIDELIKKGIK